MRLHTLRLLLAAGFLLTATASCYNYDQEDVINLAENHFINVTISVSASDAPATRAPQGGEYGDGTERGIDDRENKINNITLIFYNNDEDKGINATSDDAKVVCVKRYDVRLFNDNDLPKNHTHKTGEPTTAQGQEVLYTTGNQKLDDTQLVIGQSYKVLVVANADLYVTVGDKIKDVRDQVLSSVFTGTGIGIDASNFVMTSETDATVTLANPTADTSDGQNKMIYYFDCIHIERLAARIDYDPTGGQYAEFTATDQNGQPVVGPAANRNYKGYKYPGPGNDFFVVTKVTPFNLFNENEFCFKRVRDSWDDQITPTITYLGDETTTNYVVDPNTENKVTLPTTLSYLNPINALLPGPNHSEAYTQVMADVQGTSSVVTDTQGNKHVIIGYAKENTLRPGSLLKIFATGIAFEIKYFNGENDEHPKNFIYYHYLRHQGEKEVGSYDAKELKGPAELLQDITVCGLSPAMNYGIVRNNIYRVSIEGMTPDKVTLRIKVKKWDKFVHEPIYM